MPMELILNKKERVSSIFKKINPKTFGPHCVCVCVCVCVCISIYGISLAETYWIEDKCTQ